MTLATLNNKKIINSIMEPHLLYETFLQVKDIQCCISYESLLQLLVKRGFNLEQPIKVFESIVNPNLFSVSQAVEDALPASMFFDCKYNKPFNLNPQRQDILQGSKDSANNAYVDFMNNYFKPLYFAMSIEVIYQKYMAGKKWAIKELLIVDKINLEAKFKHFTFEETIPETIPEKVETILL